MVTDEEQNPSNAGDGIKLIELRGQEEEGGHGSQRSTLQSTPCPSRRLMYPTHPQRTHSSWSRGHPMPPAGDTETVSSEP